MTISCGYTSATALPVTWIINGTSFTLEEIVNSPLYQLNNPISPMRVSLTVFSINDTTTFQCIVLSTQTTKSTSGTVTVIGMSIHSYIDSYVHNIIEFIVHSYIIMYVELTCMYGYLNHVLKCVKRILYCMHSKF